MQIEKVYQNKTVLITGHTGFKGSWLSIWLHQMGARVIGYALEPNTVPSNFVSCRLAGRIIHCVGDVQSFDELDLVIKKYQPEFIFHLAAQPLVRFSYSKPKLTFDTNVGGTINVLEAMRNNDSVRVLVNITSDKCYKNEHVNRFCRETDPIWGRDPYSASKGCAELVFNAYLESFFRQNEIGLGSVRAGNVIGGGDWAEDRLIPDCVRALMQKEPIPLRNPGAVRPWQHVLEPLSGYLWLGALLWEHPESYSGAWNFGPNDEDQLTVGEVVEKFLECWGSGRWIDSSSQNAPFEAVSLRLCCEKANAYLKWKSTLNLFESLRMTSEWYRAFYNNPEEDIYALCVDQIRSYRQKARKQGIDWAL